MRTHSGLPTIPQNPPHRRSELAPAGKLLVLQLVHAEVKLRRRSARVDEPHGRQSATDVLKLLDATARHQGVRIAVGRQDTCGDTTVIPRDSMRRRLRMKVHVLTQ